MLASPRSEPRSSSALLRCIRAASPLGLFSAEIHIRNRTTTTGLNSVRLIRVLRLLRRESLRKNDAVHDFGGREETGNMEVPEKISLPPKKKLRGRVWQDII